MAAGDTAFLALRFISGVHLYCLIADRVTFAFVSVVEEQQVFAATCRLD